MRRILKWAGVLVGVVLALGLVLFGYGAWRTSQGLARTYAVNDPPLTIARDQASIAHGAHLFATRGCADCHGEGGRGRLVFEAGPVMKVVAPNLTPGGIVKGWSGDQIAVAIRHGVKPDGHPMVFMPTPEFSGFSDGDVTALVAYLQSLPASPNDPGLSEVRPVGKIMYALGKLPLLPAEHVDHSPRQRAAPPIAPTVEYGAYVAQGCTGCHGKDFAGQHVPGTPPSFKDAQNLTPANLGTWTEADFRRALQQGKRPDGSAIDPFMPWQQFARMSDTEVKALWAFLQTVPAKATAKR
jgi:cytochrome c553